MDRRVHRTGTDRALEKLVDASCGGTDDIGNDGGRSGGGGVALGGREVESSSVVMDLIVLTASRRRFHTIRLHFHPQIDLKKKETKKQNRLNSKKEKKIRSKKSPSLFFFLL